MNMQNKTQDQIWWGIELYNAVVTYDTISWLEQNYRLSSESAYELSEDLLQIEFPNQNLLIDVGWYNPFKTKQGVFRLVIIQNMDWEKPLFKQNFRKINTLKQKISQLINKIKQHQITKKSFG